MKKHFDRVKDYLHDMHLPISFENENESIFIVNKETAGLKNLILVVTDTILIIEQYLISIDSEDVSIYKELLIKNRDIVHGALVLDENGEKLIFRDTLQVENLDRNEIEATINSLILFLSEYSEKLIIFSN